MPIYDDEVFDGGDIPLLIYIRETDRVLHPCLDGEHLKFMVYRLDGTLDIAAIASLAPRYENRASSVVEAAEDVRFHLSYPAVPEVFEPPAPPEPTPSLWDHLSDA